MYHIIIKNQVWIEVFTDFEEEYKEGEQFEKSLKVRLWSIENEIEVPAVGITCFVYMLCLLPALEDNQPSDERAMESTMK